MKGFDVGKYFLSNAILSILPILLSCQLILRRARRVVVVHIQIFLCGFAPLRETLN
jgi:hypothetical protein